MKKTLLFLITLCISFPVFGMFRDYGNDYEDLLAQATELVHAGRNNRALRIFEWIGLRDNNQERKALAYYSQGNIWHQNNRDTLAKFYFKSALALPGADPLTTSIAQMDLGLIYASQDKLAKAQIFIRAAYLSEDDDTHTEARQWLINNGVIHPDDSELEETSHKRARVDDEISDD